MSEELQWVTSSSGERVGLYQSDVDRILTERLHQQFASEVSKLKQDKQVTSEMLCQLDELVTLTENLRVGIDVKWNELEQKELEQKGVV